MTNPLRKRMAKAALLLAATAAPVAAAGQAHAAGPALNPNANGLGSATELLAMDEQTVNEAATTLNELATPTVERLVGPVVMEAMPVLMPVVRDVAQSAAQDGPPLVEDVVTTVTGEPPTVEDFLANVPTVDDKMNDISLL
ncbi:hypothetical protein [Streptomyces mayteni]